MTNESSNWLCELRRRLSEDTATACKRRGLTSRTRALYIYSLVDVCLPKSDLAAELLISLGRAEEAPKPSVQRDVTVFYYHCTTHDTQQ